MKIKDSLVLLASIAPLAVLTAPLQAAPLVSIGDNVDVFFNGSSSVQWQSNVFYEDKNEDDDLLLTMSPGFEVNVGRGLSNLDLSIITRYDILRYNDRSNLDDEYFHIKAIGSYQTSRWDVNGAVSFDEEHSTSGQEGSSNGSDQRIVHSDNTRANIEGEYRLSPKFSVGSGVRYSDKEYTNNKDQNADQESFTIPFDVFYELTPKVDLSVGYIYTTTEVGDSRLSSVSRISGYDKDDHFFNVGARGELLPKLSGFFKVGYRVSDPDEDIVLNGTKTGERDSEGTLGLAADFTYLMTPKVTTGLQLHRGFDVGSQGQSTTNTSANLSANYSINTNYSASAFFGYTLREYEESNEDDNVYNTGVRLSYVPNQYWRFSTGYTYVENDSDRDSQGYENHMVDLSASFRY